MAALAMNLATAPALHPESTRITTTLYDLVAAVEDAAGANNDHLVATAVMHLINTNQAHFVKSRKRLAIVAA